MASPADAARVATTGGTSATLEPWVVNLPSGISSGDLLVMIFSVNNVSLANPSGWTVIFTPAIPGGHDNIWQRIWYRVADGTEGSTVSVDSALYPTNPQTTKWCAIVWRITGADTGTAPEVNTEATGNSSSADPDPGSITPAGGSKDYLFLWAGVCQGTPTMPPSGNPTNYSNPVGAGTGGGGAASSKPNVFGASRQLTASSEDAGAWAIDESNREWGVVSVAIYPGAAAVPGPVLTKTRARRADRFLVCR